MFFVLRYFVIVRVEVIREEVGLKQYLYSVARFFVALLFRLSCVMNSSSHSCDKKGTYKYLIKWVTKPSQEERITWEVPHPTLRQWIKKYNENKHKKPFELPWEYLSTDTHCVITKFTNALHPKPSD